MIGNKTGVRTGLQIGIENDAEDVMGSPIGIGIETEDRAGS